MSSLYLIPAAQTRDKDAVSPEAMKELCKKLEETFDYVIIDCPAGIEQGFRNAIAGAQKALVVTTPEVSAIRDADRVIGLLEANLLRDISLIINRVNNKMIKRGDMMSSSDICSLLSIPLIGIIPESEDVIISTNKGVPLVHEKKSPAALAFKRIAGRLEGENIPLPSDNDYEGFFSKVKRLIWNA